MPSVQARLSVEAGPKAQDPGCSQTLCSGGEALWGSSSNPQGSRGWEEKPGHPHFLASASFCPAPVPSPWGIHSCSVKLILVV